MTIEEKLETAVDPSNLERIRKNVLKLLRKDRIVDAFSLAKQGIEIANSLGNIHYQKSFLQLLAKIEMINRKSEEDNKSSKNISYSVDSTSSNDNYLSTPQFEDPFAKELENREFLEKQIYTTKKILKSRGYTIAKSKYSKSVYKKVDFLGLKIIPISDDLDVILVIPLKISRHKGVFMVDKDESSYRLASAPRNHSSSLNYLAHLIVDNSLSAISNYSFFHRSFYKEEELYRIIRKFTANNLRTKRSILGKPIYFHIRDIEQRVVIEPIFVSKRIRFLDRDLIFGYQKFSNLHYCSPSQLDIIIEYLEEKVRLLEGNNQISNIEQHIKNSRKALIGSRSASFSVIGIAFAIFIGMFLNLIPFDLFVYIGITSFIAYLFISVCLIILLSIKNRSLIKKLNTPHWKSTLDSTDPLILHARSVFSKERAKQFKYEVTRSPSISSKNKRKDSVNKSLSSKVKRISNVKIKNYPNNSNNNFYSPKKSDDDVSQNVKPNAEPNDSKVQENISNKNPKIEDMTLIEKIVKKYESFLE